MAGIEGAGGARRDRTADLYNAIVALSQLSYGPAERGTLGEPARVCQESAARARTLAQAASMRARVRSRPTSSRVFSMDGDMAVPVSATRRG